jgi:ketosteroid isomerase-like protein
MLSTGIAVEQVKAEVARFWSIFSARSSEQMQAMYSPQASVFSTWNARSEPARLTVARREREYFHAKASVRAQTGPVEVIVFENSIALASYVFELHITHAVVTGGRGTETHIENGRATQLFALDPDGKLKIVHEHLSVPRKSV